MNMNSSNNHLEDLARLAREGCAYRGRSQQADTPLPAITIQRSSYSERSFQKLITSFKKLGSHIRTC